MQTTPPAPIAGSDETPLPPGVDPDYWYALINEDAAADFRGVTKRKMQRDRQTGDGPKFVRLSSRCIRYRRIDLRADAEARIRTSTADLGEEATA